MRILIFCFAFLALAKCNKILDDPDQDVFLNVTQLFEKYGYPHSNYTVHTRDGYLLDLFRISAKTSPENQSAPQNSSSWRMPVLLMHGMMSSADEFVMAGPGQGLAYYLADKGFDVFIGNTRGSTYGRRHSCLNPSMDGTFWNFCMDTIAKSDYPAIIDEVINITGQGQMSFVGHSEGVMNFFIMASEMPSYAAKISNVVALGPTVFMGKTNSGILKEIASSHKDKSWWPANIGTYEFRPSSQLLQISRSKCNVTEYDKNVCRNAYFLIKGYQDTHFNKTTVSRMIHRIPAGASVDQIIHLAYIIGTGRFDKYTIHGPSGNGEEYNLSKIHNPISIFYTSNDLISSAEDVRKLIQKLPNVVEQKTFNQFENNLDLLYAENVDKIVYVHILNSLNSKH